jgi:hypothetical protein
MTSSCAFVSALALILTGQALRAGSLNGAILSPCTADTLSTYIDGPNTGCALGVLVSTSWGLTVDAGAKLNSGQIFVSPSTSQNGLGGSFSFSAANGFSFGVGQGQTAGYFINYSYFIDPGPILEGAELTLDPGNVTITQFFCNDLNLVSPGPSPSCASVNRELSLSVPPQTLTVTTANPNASIVFRPPALQFGSIETEIALDGTNGPANFDRITSSLVVIDSAPEPATCVLALAGLLVLAVRRKVPFRR